MGVFKYFGGMLKFTEEFLRR